MPLKILQKNYSKKSNNPFQTKKKKIVYCHFRFVTIWIIQNNKK